ncbi:MAG TPA: type II toxin-antitoxin system RelE/ParE family toxin [Planctomycetota bacterium]|nr:type II toxin-antitoxin system RelE/ParE family toxin [Planctomycetota bacterium]
MRYRIELAQNAKDDYLGFDARWRSVIKSGLDTYLSHEPMKESKSRIKRLRDLSHPQYRLRIEEIRIFYDVVDDLVTVVAIVLKKEAEAWLSRYGEK